MNEEDRRREQYRRSSTPAVVCSTTLVLKGNANEMGSIQEVYHVVSHRPIYFWSASDVDQWLRRKRPKFALKYAHFFVRHNITGRVLVDITDEDLREIGVESEDDRQDLMLEVKKEKLYSDLDEFSKLRNIQSNA